MSDTDIRVRGFRRPAPADARSIFAAPFDTLSDEELLRHYQRHAASRFVPQQDPTQTAAEKIAGVMENRFDLINEAHALLTPIDWLTNPSADIEWQILLHKFYFSVGLGAAFSNTGDARYLVKWIDLTRSWMDQVEADLLAGVSPLNSELFVAVTGRRIQNWIYAYHHFIASGAAELAASGFHRRFIASIRGQTNHLLKTLAPSRNHRTIELSAIFLAAVAFRELRDSDDWLAFASRELFENVRADLLPDGVQCELSSDYHHLVLRNYLSVRQLARMNGVDVPADIDDRLRRALEFALHIHKPDGWIPSLSDGDVGDYRALLRLGHDLYGDEALLYAASAGAEGMPPARRSVYFPDSGYAILRSGWGERELFEDERYLVFDCGPLGEGNHGHLDLLSFEAAAFGRSLLVDPGRYTYNEAGETNWRVAFRGTEYHNTVLVDGRNQTRYAPRPKKPGRANKYKIQGPAPDHELRAFVTAEGFDYLHGIGRSHEYEVVHERRIFFVGGAYWIVWDVLSGDEEHHYEQLFHLSDAAEGRVATEASDETVRVKAPNLVLARNAAPEVALDIGGGYVSRLYGEKHPAPVVRFAQRGRRAAFHTVLLPFQDAAPKLTIGALAVTEEDGAPGSFGAQAIGVSIEQPDGARLTDLCFIAPDDGRARYFGGWRFDGAWLALRLDVDGTLLQVHKDRNAGLDRLPADRSSGAHDA